MTESSSRDPHRPDARRSSIGLALLLATLSMLSPFSIDTFFPSMRAMQYEFGIDALTVQQLLTAYMVPYAVMSLVHGAVSDALGRRAVVLGGMAVYFAASVGCVFAPSFGAILGFRFAQGVTAGVGIIVGRAVIRDLYEGREAQRLMSAVTMIFGIAPAIAPIIGGWVHVWLGWRGVFAFLGLLSALLIALTWKALPETHPRHARVALQPASLARTSIGILRNTEFFSLAACNGLLFGTIWVYIGSAPAIVVDAWGLGETDFAQLFVPLISGYVLGALVSGRLAGRVAASAQMRIGLVVTCCGGLIAVPVGYFEPGWIWLQQLAMGITAAGLQLCAPIVTLRALDLFAASRGAVSSLLAFVQLALAALILAGTPLLGPSIGAIGVVSLVAAGLAILCWRVSGREQAGA